MWSANRPGVRRRWFALLCLSPWVAPLPGATLERLSLTDLVQKSTDIVRATVSGTTTDVRGAVIYTHYQIQVTNRFKGAAQASMDVLVPGGAAGGVRQYVPGAPKLALGPEYVLFLWTSKSGTTYITGWGQGVLSLTKDSSGNLTAWRRAIDETILDPATWLVVKDSGFSMAYANLTTQIAAILNPGASQ